ncbi:hypothetical protein [Paenibacillus sp. 1001270B_150601_E10]|uniref:hypothetical protein n=1 Tax=Paenibacillus sp. 1001270B_150601_E10 TaxID=2787079 RepID=UPI00189E878F|nr:hypothetical protein [Paenibacillus sp. 1001270B_150601_E10]
MSEKIEKLRMFLIQYIDELTPCGGGGGMPDLPEFDLYAVDYLDFAQVELEKNTSVSLINCVSHLKRAMDCQLDTFLFVYNLYNITAKKNLKFEKKLDFLNDIGVFNSRVLVRINTIRNRMEHKFEIPKITDIEMYFDLVSAFVAILQSLIVFTLESSLEYEYSKGSFSIFYSSDEPSVVVRIYEDTGVEYRIVANTSNMFEFTYFFKVWFLLVQSGGFASNKYILRKLDEGINFV